MYSQDVVEWVDKYWSSRSFPFRDLVVSSLKDQTQWLDPLDPSLRHRMFVIRNQMYSAPLCKHCGARPALLNVTKHELGFREYCSAECSRAAPKISIDAHTTLNNKEWLYERRVVQKISIENIAKMIGVSITPVEAALKKFSLDHVDTRKKHFDTIHLLESEEWMFQMYVIEHKKLEEIASITSTSLSTAQRWLSIHGIEARDPNSYDRPHIRVSKPQQEIYDFVKTLLSEEVVLNDRSTIGSEMDIYVPSARLGIEYHGLYSHIHRPSETTDAKRKGPKYHLSKTTSAEERGVRLLQFFSDEWRLKKPIVQSMIAARLNKSLHRVFARQCVVKEISTHVKDTFLERCHIQGKDRSNIKLGLFYNEQLVSVMTFAKPRFNKECEWELMRFACELNYSVVGGFQKLWTHAIKNNLISGNVVSYSDRRYSQGNVYESNGWTKIRINKPTYYYVDTNKDIRLNRMHGQKKYFEKHQRHLTEKELTIAKGWGQVFDCGTVVWTKST